MSMVSNVNFNKSLSNISFRAMTPGHFQNTPFDTNLNNYLRYNENTVLVDELNNLALMNQQGFWGGKNYYSKEHIEKNKVEEVKKQLNKEFEQLPPLEKSKSFYRGLVDVSDENFKKFEQMKVGETVIPDKGFAYVTPLKETAATYTQPPKGSTGTNRVLLEYILPKGYKVSETGKMGIAMSRGIPQVKFDEAMLPAGCAGELISKVRDKDGLLKLTIKMLLK